MDLLRCFQFDRLTMRFNPSGFEHLPEIGVCERVALRGLRLQVGFASRSFAGMRVEAVGEMPKRTGAAGVVTGDAGASLAIKSFLAAIESDDSLFCIAQPLAGPSADKSASGGVSSGDIVIEFRQDDLKSQKSLHFLLIEKLTELLKEAGSSESLETTLCLTSGSISVSATAGASSSQDRPPQKELALWLRLAAKGVSQEQAVLRWGLGLAHLQQALLFTSRHLRQHIAQMHG
jgi:hypothetical protein